MPLITCKKRYRDIPFAHRQHNHRGHCRFIHGHNWTFTFVFGCSQRDKNGFVIDFGELDFLKAWINARFDHKLLINDSDPGLKYLLDTMSVRRPSSLQEGLGPFAEVSVVPDASCEGLALFLYSHVAAMVHELTAGRVRLLSVDVKEDSKNSAKYTA